MMLTGFDAPPLHTLYLDRPLKGALLMYPPDKQPAAIRLVTDQMETMAPRFAEGRE